MASSLFRLCLCVVLSVAAGCANLATDNLPPDAPKGRVRISLESRSHMYHVGVYQEIDGNVQSIGSLRSRGIEIGDYRSITVTARPGPAKFHAEVGDDRTALPFVVDVIEGATIPVRIVLKPRPDGGYVTFQIDPPVWQAPRK